jgi:hypothetical protein
MTINFIIPMKGLNLIISDFQMSDEKENLNDPVSFIILWTLGISESVEFCDHVYNCHLTKKNLVLRSQSVT